MDEIPVAAASLRRAGVTAVAVDAEEGEAMNIRWFKYPRAHLDRSSLAAYRSHVPTSEEGG